MSEVNAAGPERKPWPAMNKGALGAWWRQGARSAVFMRPDWRDLQTTPATVAWLVVVLFLWGVLVQRLFIPGAATFYWPGIQSGWLWSVMSLWACWVLVPCAESDGTSDRAPSPSALFALMAAQAFTIDLALTLPLVAIAHAGTSSTELLGLWGAWLAWGLPLVWTIAAQLMLVWRSGSRRALTRGLAMLLLGGTLALNQWVQPMRLWYPDVSEDSAQGPQPLRLTQTLLEAQAQVQAQALAAIAAHRPGPIDVYTITFAPYAGEDVFLRESQLVADVMADRFDSKGRTIQLVNHRSTIQQWPWATPLNLQRAIQRIAERMDRDKDVLFIHLTSHGGRSGRLSAEFWPLEVEALTPQMLKTWLDQAGIHHRIVSVSACYSGSWIDPLADDNTLVMTAADADHTSYGCGSKSALTYFGRAMFDEQMRKTWSFEAAHAEARLVIDKREHEAGKTDGYSNPQIRVGSAMREQIGRAHV